MWRCWWAREDAKTRPLADDDQDSKMKEKPRFLLEVLTECHEELAFSALSRFLGVENRGASVVGQGQLTTMQHIFFELF